MSWRGIRAMEKMCDNCPFGHTKEQRHMRNSLVKGRFDEICQSVFRGEIFMCHKTTTHDDDRECAGSIRFREEAWRNRQEAERRAAKVRA